MSKQVKITIAVTFAVVALGLSIIWLFGDKFVNYDKEYSTKDITFKSDEALIEKEKEEMDIYFENLTGDVIVLGRKEKKESFDDLDEFVDFMYSQRKEDVLSEINKKDDFYYFTYKYTEGNVFYLGAMYETDNNYFIINFACQLNSKDLYEDRFLEWASSVKFNSN